jgi:putative oxidoreductase
MQSWDRFTPQMLSILRIVTCLVFIPHGLQKLFGFPAPPPGGTPALMSLYGAAALVEVILGPLLLLGVFTRWCAFFLSGEMAIAYWYSHFPRNGGTIWPLLNGGDAAVLYCFIFLFIACAGAGAWGVDRAIRGSNG